MSLRLETVWCSRIAANALIAKILAPLPHSEDTRAHCLLNPTRARRARVATNCNVSRLSNAP